MTNTLQSIENTRIAYDRSGARYDLDTDRFNTEVAYPRLIELLKGAVPGSISGRHILDVGCGSGRLVRMLQAAGAHANGIELSPKSVARARACGLAVKEGSMLALPYPDEAFDAVVSYHSFNYAPHEEHAHALFEQARVMKRGGILVLGAFPSHERTERSLALFQNGEQFLLHLRTYGEIEALMATAGLHVLRRDEPLFRKEHASLLPPHVRTLARTGHPYVLSVIARKQ